MVPLIEICFIETGVGEHAQVIKACNKLWLPFQMYVDSDVYAPKQQTPV